MLGVGAKGEVELIVSPAAPAPRKDAKRRSRLVEEHRRRVGDPREGGGRASLIMTAYRQRALACANALADGPQTTRGAARPGSRRDENSLRQRLWLVRAGFARRL